MSDSQAAMTDLHIMIVEDNPLTAIDINKILQELGVAQTHTTTNGREALDWLEQTSQHCDVIFMDLRMPQMGGIDLLHRLADKNYAGSVIVLSGADADTLSAVEALAHDHSINLLGTLPKPPDAAHIAELLSRASPTNA